MMGPLIELFKLPAVGPLVGATIALTGVFATLLAQSWERRRDREFNNRRDVYLKAAEAIAQQINVLASMGNMSLAPAEIASLSQGNPGWMNKVHMVASLETIRSLNEFNEFSAQKTLELIEQRIDVDDLNRKSEGLHRELGLLSDYQRQGSAALQALAQQPSTPENQKPFDWLLSELKQSKLHGDNLNQQLADLGQQRQKLHRKLLEASTSAAIEAQSHLAAANLAIRRELRLNIDHPRYTAMLKASGDRLSGRFKALLDKIDLKQP